MTLLLYLSYREELANEEVMMEINSCLENHKVTYRFDSQISLNVKTIIKRSIGSFVLIITVSFGDLKPEPVHGMGLPVSGPTLIKIQPYSKHSRPNPEIAKPILPKSERVRYESFSKSNEEILFLIYAIDRKFSNEQIFRLMTDVRGGDWYSASALLILLLLICTISTSDVSAFLPEKVGWGLNNPPPPQHIYPPFSDVLFPRGSSYADRPGGSQIRSHSSREELSQLSTNVIPSKPQIFEFMENERVDIHKCLEELNRRAKEIGCTNFECSPERFKALATENGDIKPQTAREAITILQGEMLGYYKNAARENYGETLKGLDFLVDGLGEYKNITHVDVKNPVSSAIKVANNQSASVYQQGRDIGRKFIRQQKKWSDPSFISQLKNLRPTASLPQSTNNTLGLIDFFDVPPSEIPVMEKNIIKGSKNNTNVVFINNRR